MQCAISRARSGGDGFPLVMIEWVDSAQPISSWQWIDEMPEPSLTICRSVGWLVYDGEDVKSVAPNLSVSDDNAQVSGVIRIPTRCIIRIAQLDPPWGPASASSSHPG
jgi:hypothetical protein